MRQPKRCFSIAIPFVLATAIFFGGDVFAGTLTIKNDSGESRTYQLSETITGKVTILKSVGSSNPQELSPGYSFTLGPGESATIETEDDLKPEDVIQTDLSDHDDEKSTGTPSTNKRDKLSPKSPLPKKKQAFLTSYFHQATKSPTTNTTTSSSVPPPIPVGANGEEPQHSPIPQKVNKDSEEREQRDTIRRKIEELAENWQLNIYLLKKYDKSSPPPEVISEEIRRKFRDFPWQFIKEDKHELVCGSREQAQFIDGQVYTEIPDGDGVEIYLFQETGVHQVQWIKMIRKQTAKHEACERVKRLLHEGTPYKEPKGAIIFVKKKIGEEDRFFAITFGPSGRYLLNLDCCDPTFGKHYAYNILSSNQDYRTRAFTEIDLNAQTLKHEHAKLRGELQVLRGIRAFIPRALTVTDKEGTPICSFLGAHIRVKHKFTFETIGDLCQEVLQISEKPDYKARYNQIDHFTPLEDKSKIDDIFNRGLEEFDIEPPFEAEGETDIQTIKQLELSSRFSWEKNFSTLQESYKDFSELAAELKRFIQENRLNRKILEKLKKLKVLAKDESGQIVGSWSADQLITTLVKTDERAYWIEGGEIFEVHRDFIKMIDDRLDAFFLQRSSYSSAVVGSEYYSLSMLGPFTNEDLETRQGRDIHSEGAYNRRMAETHPAVFFLQDCQTIPLTSDSNKQSKVEPCDLLSREGDFIHVKKWSESSVGISHLVVQAVSSSSLFIRDKEYRRIFLEKLSKNKDFSDTREKLSSERYRNKIILAIIHHDANFTPSKLPFNAKLALFKAIEEIEALGLKCKIISIKDDSTRQTKAKKSQQKPTSKKRDMDLPQENGGGETGEPSRKKSRKIIFTSSSSEDIHWYDDGEINALLRQYVGDNVTDGLMDAIHLEQREGKTLEENLRDREEGLNQQETQVPAIVLPINLGAFNPSAGITGTHWVAVYIRRATPDSPATITYIDPLGRTIPAPLANILHRCYGEDVAIIDPGTRFQEDGYNCGPWVVEILRCLIESNGVLPAEGFVIRDARVEHRAVLLPLHLDEPRRRDGESTANITAPVVGTQQVSNPLEGVPSLPIAGIMSPTASHSPQQM